MTSASTSEICGIVHDRSGTTDEADVSGCLLHVDHTGPHEFEDQRRRRWNWDVDLECDCEHCMQNEGDYCTIYWIKSQDLLEP